MEAIDGFPCPEESSQRTASIRESIRSVSGEWSFSNTAAFLWNISDRRATHSEYISHDSTASVIAGDAWLTIKLSAVNNRLCKMSMICCCFFPLCEWFGSWLKMASCNGVARYCCHLLHCCDTTVQTAESPKNYCDFASLTRSRDSIAWILQVILCSN